MLYLLHTLSISVYTLIAYQDLRYRAVSWVIFLISLLINLIYLLFEQKMPLLTFFQNVGINLIFIVSQFVMLTIYFSLKHRKLINIADKYIGWGDLVFYVITAIVLSPLLFLLFHVGSLVFCLLIYLCIHYFRKRPFQYQIPLAGIQSILMILLTIFQVIFSSFSLHEDSWLVNLIAYG